MATTKRQRQKEARRQKMEAMQRQNKRRQNLRRGVIALVVGILVIGSAALFFHKSSPPTVTIPTTTTPTPTTTIGTVSKSCSTSAFAAAGFASIPCASPAGTSKKAPTMVIPTTTAPTSIQVADLIKGTGAVLKKGASFTAQYVLADYASHSILQSSWTSGPFTATLKTGAGGLIPGWVTGLPGMKVGGRRELILPPSLAYGAKGQSGIPGNDTLVFIVDLLKIG
jgi:peptidylprolyl isomerase